MTAVDRYGFEMSKTPQGPRPVRLAFAKQGSTPEEVRGALLRDARLSWVEGHGPALAIPIAAQRF
jgi:hypothetical protein